jgi:predicted small secreted protein
MGVAITLGCEVGHGRIEIALASNKFGLQRKPDMRNRLMVCLSILLLAAAAPALTACNTTAGAGKDISNTGKVITRGADQLKP